MSYEFIPAEEVQTHARLSMFGPAGSGKTYTALSIASGLGKKVAVIDTERGSAAKYAKQFEFHHLKMEPPYAPTNFIQAMKAALDGGFDVLVIDSITHEWDGKGGIKEIVDKAAERKGGNSWAGWAVGTPEHNKFVDAMLAIPMHVIATMRAKTEWALEDKGGKKTPRKIGLGAQQRDGIEYEFDVVMLMDMDNGGTIVKSRSDIIVNGEYIEKPDKAFGEKFLSWVSSGEKPSSASTKPPDANGGASPSFDKAEPVANEGSDGKASPVGGSADGGDASTTEVQRLIKELSDTFPDAELLEGMSWGERIAMRSVEWFNVKLEDLEGGDLEAMIGRLGKTKETLEAGT